MSYVPEAWNVTQPDGATVLAKTAAAEFQELKKYLTKVPQEDVSANYTFVRADSGKRKIHPTADTTARDWTIPPNSSVPFDIGTVISVGVRNSAGTVTLTQGAGVTLRRAGTGTTGNLALIANSWATIEKVDTDEWYIYGTGLP